MNARLSLSNTESLRLRDSCAPRHTVGLKKHNMFTRAVTHRYLSLLHGSSTCTGLCFVGHTWAIEQEEWASEHRDNQSTLINEPKHFLKPRQLRLVMVALEIEGEREKKKNCVRELEFKLMLRYKLLSARGAGEEKNISSWLKGLRTRKGNIGEDKLRALEGKGSLEKQKARGKAARKPSWEMQGERDSVLALAVSCFSLSLLKTGRRDRWEACLQQDPQWRQGNTPHKSLHMHIPAVMVDNSDGELSNQR